MRRSLSLLHALSAAVALITAAHTSSAQPASEAPPPSAPDVQPAPPPASPAVSDADIALWQQRYAEARAALLQGRFFEAVGRFHDVARYAPDPVLRASAAELESVAGYWWQRGLAIRPMAPGSPGAPAPSDRTSASADKRTIDELAVLYTTTLIWGAGFGFTVGLAARTGGAATYFLPGIGMAALGAGAVALADWKAGPLRYGVPHSVTAGVYIGLEAGLFSSLLVGRSVSLSEGATAGIIWGAATAGGLLGGALGHEIGTTPGRASFVETGALWGGFLTTFISVGALPDTSGSQGVVVAGAAGLIGMTAGAVATGLLGNRFSPSIARVRFIDLGGFGGGLLAAGIYASANRSNSSPRPFFLVTALGTGVGLGITALVTRNMDADLPRRRADEGWIMPTFAPMPGGATAGLAGMF